MQRLSLIIAVCLCATGAQAACYADYKAKRDNPLRLHYGVIRLDDAACADPGRARQEVRKRIAGDGWKLLSVVSTFGENGLARRRPDAGDYYLRY